MANQVPVENLIREIRTARKLSQEQLAEKVNTSFQQISRLEKGIRGLKPDWLERIASALDVRPAALIDRKIGDLFDPEKNENFAHNEGELRLLRIWRNIGDDAQIAIMSTARALLVAGQTAAKVGEIHHIAVSHDDAPQPPKPRPRRGRHA